ncbi:MAG: lipoate--protein ligase family protein [Calditrichaeota bacterium]|nr:lipoate--protein ligase family protein [Calditrichota bacterium]
MDEWRFLNTGFGDGFNNMVIDEILATKIVPETKIPIFRLYRWRPYAISLGYHQDVNEFNLELCARDNIDLVRRPTGGRAVFHAEEMTYSVVIPKGHPFFAEDIFTTYNKISRGLLQGLRSFGVDAELVRREDNEAKSAEYKQSVPCFSTSARFEIAFGGKKLVGSAQRRYENSILQHGSILTGTFHLNLAKYVKLKTGITEESFREQLDKKTVTISQILSKPVAWEALAEALQAGFQKKFNIRFIDSQLTPREMAEVEKRKKTYPNMRRKPS